MQGAKGTTEGEADADEDDDEVTEADELVVEDADEDDEESAGWQSPGPLSLWWSQLVCQRLARLFARTFERDLHIPSGTVGIGVTVSGQQADRGGA